MINSYLEFYFYNIWKYKKNPIEIVLILIILLASYVK